MSPLKEPGRFFLAGIILVMSLVVRAEAQGIGQPPALSSPGGQMAPAEVETLSVELGWGGDLPAPQRVLVFPDSLFLGDVLTVGVDVSGTNVDWPDSLLGSGSAWLIPLDPEITSVDNNWPVVSKDKARLVRKFRVYNLDPFQLHVQGVDSKVVVIKHRAKDQQTMAAVRDPRSLGWRPAHWVIFSVLVLVVALLVWFLWRRRKTRTSQPPHNLLPVPAWLASACELQELYNCGLVDQGQGRVFLDRLAGLVRSYLVGRYGIGAMEMTAKEIEELCQDRAYEPEAIQPFITVIAKSDHWRYRPEAPALEDCRAAAGDFFKTMGLVRIMPEFTPVPADLALRAGQAWAALERELACGYFKAEPESMGVEND